MAKSKGKKKGDPPKQPALVSGTADSPPALTIPPPAWQAYPEPEPGKAPNNAYPLQTVSPRVAQQDVLSSGTQVASDWPSQGQLGDWGQTGGQTSQIRDWGGGDDEHYDEGEDEDEDGEYGAGYGERYEDEELGSGSGTPTSPGVVTNPTSSHNHSRNVDAWGMHTTQGTMSQKVSPAVTNKRMVNPQVTDGHGHVADPQKLPAAPAGFGDTSFGKHPDPPSSAVDPTVKRRNTLRKHPPAAPKAPEPPVPLPPAKQSKHVAFGSLPDFLHTFTGQHRDAHASSPALATSVAPGLLSTQAIRSHRQPQGGPESLPVSLGILGGHHGGQSPWTQNPLPHPQHNVSHTLPATTSHVAMNHMQPSSTAPYSQQAWTKWSSEAKNFGMPAIATTMKASVPAVSFSPGGPAYTPAFQHGGAGNPAYAAAAAREGQLRSHLQQYEAPQTETSPSIRQSTGPATSQATWKYLQEKGHLPTPLQGRAPHLHGHPQRPAEMQAAGSWGVAGGNANPDGWGAAAANPGPWGNGGGGNEWGATVANAGPWGAGGGGGSNEWGLGAADPMSRGKSGGGGAGGWGQTPDPAAANAGWGDAVKDAWSAPNDTTGWGAPDTTEHRRREDRALKHRNDPVEKGRSRHKQSPDVGGNGAWGYGGGGGGGGDNGGWGQAAAAYEPGTAWGQVNPDDHASGKTHKRSSKHHQSSKHHGSSRHHDDSRQDHSWGRVRMEEVPEEEEDYDDENYDDEDEDDEDDLDSMYTEPKPDGYKAGQQQGRRNPHISPRISYTLSPAGYTNPHTGGTPRVLAAGTPHMAQSILSAGKHYHDQGAFFDPNVSQTMNIAAGRTDGAYIIPDRIRSDSVPFSEGAGLEPAKRALFLTKAVDPKNARPAKDRIYWMFNPEKDPRVASLLRWVNAMSDQLAVVGLNYFLETRERGALIANAEFRTHHAGTAMQPAFDWISLQDANFTLDATLQKAVLRYNPAEQVIVFVFLMSTSGNSVAMWRRKCPIPEANRLRSRGVIDRTVQNLRTSAVILVDELPPPKPPPQPEAKKKRSWWKKIFLFWKK